MLMNKRKLLGLIAVVSMLTLTFVSCQEGSNSPLCGTESETSVVTEVSTQKETAALGTETLAETVQEGATEDDSQSESGSEDVEEVTTGSQSPAETDPYGPQPETGAETEADDRPTLPIRPI